MRSGGIETTLGAEFEMIIVNAWITYEGKASLTVNVII
jgi:hypothetical protein